MKLFVSKIFDTYVTWPNPSGRSLFLDGHDFYQMVRTQRYRLPSLYMSKGEPLHLIIPNTGKVESYINLGLDTRIRCEKCAFRGKHIDIGYCTNRMFLCNGAYAKAESLLEEL